MSIVFKILKRALAALITLFCIGVIVFLIWRINSSGAPKELEVLSPNASLAEAYDAHGDRLYAFFQPRQLEYTANTEASGYFFVTDTAIIPAANQIQTLVRYNNSTLDAVAEDFSLPSVPARDSEVFEYSIVVAIDLTPDDKSDNLEVGEDKVKLVTYKGKVTDSGEKNIYNFRRVVFDLDTAELDLEALMESGELIAIYMEYSLIGNSDGVSFANMCLYDYLYDNEQIKLSKKDIEAIEKFKEQN